MDDKLLARADRALRDSQFIREQARENLLRAKFAAASLKRTLHWARSVGVKRHPQIGLEMADMIAAAQENPAAAANTASGSSMKSRAKIHATQSNLDPTLPFAVFLGQPLGLRYSGGRPREKFVLPAKLICHDLQTHMT